MEGGNLSWRVRTLSQFELIDFISNFTKMAELNKDKAATMEYIIPGIKNLTFSIQLFNQKPKLIF